MKNYNRHENKVKYSVNAKGELQITYEFPVTRHFKFTNPKQWDGTIEDLLGLLLSSFVNQQVHIIDQKTDTIVKSGIKETFDPDFYEVVMEKDEWCSIVNPDNEIIYARFISYQEHKTFESRLKKLITDFFEAKGFEIECV